MLQAIQELPESEREMVAHRDGFATAKEAAGYLHVSKAMVHLLINRGELPCRRYGRAVRIPWAWLKAQAGEQ